MGSGFGWLGIQSCATPGWASGWMCATLGFFSVKNGILLLSTSRGYREHTVRTRQMPGVISINNLASPSLLRGQRGLNTEAALSPTSIPVPAPSWVLARRRQEQRAGDSISRSQAVLCSLTITVYARRIKPGKFRNYEPGHKSPMTPPPTGDHGYCSSAHFLLVFFFFSDRHQPAIHMPYTACPLSVSAVCF